MNDLISLLSKHGPALSTTLAERLRKTGLSPEAARQRLSRLPAGVTALSGLTFPKRARFIYLQSQFQQEGYWVALVNAIKSTKSAYGVAIAGIQARGGLVPVRHFDIVSGAPFRQARQIASSTVLERLTSIGLLISWSIPGVGECVQLKDYSSSAPDTSAVLRARLMTENVLLDAIREWGSRLNLTSRDATTLRDDEPAPTYSTFKFDLCGPSYVRGLTRRNGDKMVPGFFVADVILGTTLNEERVAPFLRKCDMLSYLPNVPPCMPMLIADNFTPEALRACRAKGVMATRPATLFGEDVARALSDLFHTLSNAAVVAAKSPEQLEELFNRLSSIEGRAGNLRGALFELIVGHVVRELVGGSIDMGFNVEDKEARAIAEIDIRLVKQKNVYIYECKGYQPDSLVSHAEIEDWLTRCVPRIYNHHKQQERFQSSAIRFEFWTCGRFHPDALKTLETAAARIRKYEIGWRDGPAIREFALGLNKPGIKKILDEHYFNHPLASLAKEPRRRRPQPGDEFEGIKAAE